jgi:hypothetical protein
LGVSLAVDAKRRPIFSLEQIGMDKKWGFARGILAGAKIIENRANHCLTASLTSCSFA